jgi:hypothetical protein
MTITTDEFAPEPVGHSAALPPLVHRRYFGFLGIVLLGYALAGRGFAYVGLPPIFIGEISLAVGILLLGTVNRWRELAGSPSTWPLLALFAWGGLQTMPYLRVYGIECLRDAVGWGYGVFAIVVAAMILDHEMLLDMAVGLYERFFKLFLPGIPVTFVVYRSMGAAMPHWPWADIKILQIKEGDAMVHLSGILAFWVSGLAGKIGWGWTALLTVDAVVLGVIDRAGMIAFLAVFAICMAYRPGHGVTAKAIAILLTVCVALFASDVHIPVPDGKGRDISFHQVITNLGSVAGDSGSDGLDSTKEWRLDWWRTIRGYTFFGKYFWTGKGFGINLADEDGFQMLSDHSLRNPHSVHMTMLARGGVPMLVFWLASVGSWYWLMGRNLLRARREGQRFWEGLFFFLPTYVLAFLINGSFDVFIEGPMGGIWMWTLYGIGLGAALVHHRQPAGWQT